MGFSKPVDLSYGVKPGLSSVAGALPAGWERGIEFRDTSCLAPVSYGECPTAGSISKQAPSVAEFRPFTVKLVDVCTTLGDGGDVKTAEDGLAGSRDWALYNELMFGTVTARDAQGTYAGNPSLTTEAVDVSATPVDWADAIDQLVEGLYDANYGRPGVVFAPYGAANRLAHAGAVHWADGWFTAQGLPVVFAGDGTGLYDPGDPEPADGPPVDPSYESGVWVYATTAVWAGFQDMASVTTYNRSVNDREAMAENLALVAFTPCSTVAVKLPDYAGVVVDG